MSRSDSPLINDSHDLSSPNFEHRSLADIMSLFSINQSPPQQQQQQQQNQPQQQNHHQRPMEHQHGNYQVN